MKAFMLAPKYNEFDRSVFAWSMKQLSKNQKKCITIRNSLGNELDIGFSNGTINKDAIAAFANGARATVSKLYDASTNKNHAYNSSAALQWAITDGSGVPLNYIDASYVSGGSYFYMTYPKHSRFAFKKATFVVDYAIPSAASADRHLFSFNQIDTNIQYRMILINSSSKMYTYLNTSSVNFGNFTLESTLKKSTWTLDLTKTTGNSIEEREGQTTDTKDVSFTIDPSNCWFLIGARSSSTSTGAALTSNRFTGYMKSFVMFDKNFDSAKIAALKGVM